jgi:hypothetical protein
MNFFGPGNPLTQGGLNDASKIADVGLSELWALVSVETSGCGYLPDRRPKILFERHIFSRLTGRKFDADDPEVSQPSQGGYGPSGTYQYDRLTVAMDLDSDAALKSASWGLGQIMGENFKEAGFASVDDMVAGMIAREDNQIAAITAFLHSTGMDDALRNHDWAGFARRYNGPNYAANNYDGTLGHFYAIYSSGDLPSLEIRSVQVALIYAGYPVGRVDGIVGRETSGAIRQYQTANGLTVTGQIDDELIAKLGL